MVLLGNPASKSLARNKEGDNKLAFELTLKTVYNGDISNDGINPTAVNSITLNHEAFIHFFSILLRIYYSWA